MSTMAAPPPFPAGPVHRKPVANPNVVVRLPSHLQSESSGHSRTRTTSSGIFPAAAPAPAPPPTNYTPPGTMHSSSQYPTQYPPQPVMGMGTRRTLSNATSSTSSTTGTPARSNSGALRRSSSARSGTSPTSYVALMRKQKATVWCDRAQYEDPRMQAQQRAAKMRANMEVAGGHHAGPRNVSGSSSMAAGVRSKIRHHGAPKASLYAPANLAGTGVPMRLSASEVDEGDSEDTGSIGKEKGPYHHHRTGSGRSSLGSGRRVAYANPSGRLSTSSTPPSGHNSSPTEGMEDLMEEETPVPYAAADYFEHTKTGLSNLSGGSGSSGERNFGGVSEMAPSLLKPHQQNKGAEDLHRRGSVDERTTTMSNTRLFIANPDLSD
ncbi:hypothetical protein P154DRAFT_38319 [Amniculicola lignicola CBS 123094]|uniref:Uncharacterized protein n=1 Tax=Amniculicola lignicola CBS 123094 TaxID=1392246 RepID=A0A6A5W9B5_9PLEO|nr:hypothetical protein P154DRAFT_38319 [Amniculicola lignicola CBS 123094]